jgi:hypothetical protein
MSPVSLALALSLLLGAAPPETAQAPAADTFKPDPAWKPRGKSLWFDPAQRRLIMRARVCTPAEPYEGPFYLEHLLCLKGTKEHEAILATEATPRLIHQCLLLTGADVGHPVRFLPSFEPPTGSAISIELQWEQGGKLRTADARQWIIDEKTKAVLATDWVFAGSELREVPDSPMPVYAADEGDLITVANFANAILDLPFASSANDASRGFVANLKQIPPRGTMVTMILKPRAAPPKPKR